MAEGVRSKGGKSSAGLRWRGEPENMVAAAEEEEGNTEQ